MTREILVVPFPHPGHLFPATELCNQLAARNYNVTLLYPSSSSSSSSLHPSIQIVEFPLSDSIKLQPSTLNEALSNLIADYFDGRDSFDFPVCTIVDEMIISWVIDPLLEFGALVVSFFTSSASSTALGHATVKFSATDELTPGGILAVPGLPADMALTWSALAAGRSPSPWRRGLEGSDGATVLIFNTCDDLERPFLDYVAKAAGKPVWGVGPLLPVRFKDGEVRPNREIDVSEGEVMEWLDSKPRGSVIYVSFGSLVSPTDGELAELAAGLEESNRPFIWVIKPDARRHGPTGQRIEGEDGGGGGYFPADMARRVGLRGLIIRGWAPQLSILNHPSTGAYVCHCGWNSTVEALACGVPMLTWPVRGDQHHNAKLVTAMLKVGLPVKKGDLEVRKEDVMGGIERLMGDEEIKERAVKVRSVFAGGFPKSSSTAIDSFLDFMSTNK